MSDDLIVLLSFPVPRPTTNPYNIMLERSLREQPGVTCLNFRWRTAVLGRYDVFHVHWPEILVSGHSPLKKLVRQALVVALLARLAITRTPIVRTVHNVELPQGISRREVLLLRWIDRATDLRIRLNPETPVPAGSESVTIPLGHYRDWYASVPRHEVVPGRLGYFGMVRRYKGVEGLVAAFRGTQGVVDGLSLRIGGTPSTEGLAADIEDLARGDARISIELGFLSDAALVELATSSELVVMPYRFMHNSSGAITALSLDRPVLVPDNAVNRLLGEEVGPGWVFRYRGELTAAGIVEALGDLRAGDRSARPNLDARDWRAAGADHVRAYRAAIAHSRRPTSPRRPAGR